MPERAKSLALILDDPDSPSGTFVHWVLYDIDPKTNLIEENSEPGTSGINDFKKTEYSGPCPGSGKHRYFFKLYALDTRLELPPGSDKQQVERAMQGHILDQAELIGLFEK